eukprot:COSAG02_NODE_4722_length_5052_cov_9.256612_3_plen_101_part_00
MIQPYICCLYSYPYPLPVVHCCLISLTMDPVWCKLTAVENGFDAAVSFDLMSSGRWRFQRQMEQSFKINEEVFGEDSEEMLQMRDLFANTHPYLLTGEYA